VFQPILGPSHTTKQHRLSVHKLDELCMKGNLHDGISAYNVALHKHEKAAFTLTNHEWGQFVERLIIKVAVAHLKLANDETERKAEKEGLGLEGDDEEEN